MTPPSSRVDVFTRWVIAFFYFAMFYNVFKWPSKNNVGHDSHVTDVPLALACRSLFLIHKKTGKTVMILPVF